MRSLSFNNICSYRGIFNSLSERLRVRQNSYDLAFHKNNFRRFYAFWIFVSVYHLSFSFRSFTSVVATRVGPCDVWQIDTDVGSQHRFVLYTGAGKPSLEYLHNNAPNSVRTKLCPRICWKGKGVVDVLRWINVARIST